MVFPRTGLSNRVTVVRQIRSGTDDDDNPTYVPEESVSRRQARFYRDMAKESRYVRDGVNVTGMVAFKALSADEVADSDTIFISGGRLGEGKRFDIVHAQLLMLWHERPSHWEIVVGEQH